MFQSEGTIVSLLDGHTGHVAAQILAHAGSTRNFNVPPGRCVPDTPQDPWTCPFSEHSKSLTQKKVKEGK